MADNNSGEGILAFILGGVIGAVVGLLLAPCSGEETRKRISEWLEENREKTRKFLDEERSSLKDKKDKLSAAWEAGKKAFTEDDETQDA